MSPGSENRTRHSLIALIALRQAKAIKEREAREAAVKSDGEPTKPKKRGWFG